MKITPVLLSIPPYLSTTWENISSLRVRVENEKSTLIALLQNKIEVEVPDLDSATIEQIFEAHAKYAEEETSTKTPLSPLDGPFSFSLPLKGGGLIDTLGPNMQHNPAQADLPPLPPDVLQKITTIARAFGLDDSSALPKGELNCNCIYCQVARALHGEEPLQELEVVTDEDIKFRNWEVKQTDDQLYTVTNPLDLNETYNVFLGEPLGCTCGEKNCEHIRAVLKS
ncbi:MAG: hypothetical protein V4487_05065 [Chlamydiota bacterium]